MQADIAQPAVANVPQRADHAVEEWFAADEPVIRAHRCAPGEMFARAKADFDFERAIVAEQYVRIERAFRDGQLRQQIVDQRRLALPQFVPLPPSVQPADR